jgi:hypothetical protein
MDPIRAQRLRVLLSRYLVGASAVELLVGVFLIFISSGPKMPPVAWFGGIHVVAAACSLASCRRDVANQTWVTGGASMLALAAVLSTLIVQQGGVVMQAYTSGNGAILMATLMLLVAPAIVPMVFATMGLGLLVEMEAAAQRPPEGR